MAIALMTIVLMTTCIVLMAIVLLASVNQPKDNPTVSRASCKRSRLTFHACTYCTYYCTIIAFNTKVLKRFPIKVRLIHETIPSSILYEYTLLYKVRILPLYSNITQCAR